MSDNNPASEKDGANDDNRTVRIALEVRLQEEFRDEYNRDTVANGVANAAVEQLCDVEEIRAADQRLLNAEPAEQPADAPWEVTD